jgi:hypothetical protein
VQCQTPAWQAGTNPYFYRSHNALMFVQGLSPKAEKLVNRRLDMIDTRIAGQPGYLLDNHDKISFWELGLIIDRAF